VEIETLNLVGSFKVASASPSMAKYFGKGRD